MKQLLLAALAGLAVATPLAGFGGLDEIQRQAIWRAHEAKRKQAAAEAEQQRQMQAHGQLMTGTRVQMSADRPPDGLSAQEMREWLDQHLRRMDEAMTRLIDQYRGVMPGAGK